MLRRGSWSPAGKIFWLTVFGLVSPQDPLQAGATGTAFIRCFEVDSTGAYTLLDEAQSQLLDVQTLHNSWRHLSTWVQCGSNANLVQMVLAFEQVNINTDHGSVYFDDADLSQRCSSLLVTANTNQERSIFVVYPGYISADRSYFIDCLHMCVQ